MQRAPLSAFLVPALTLAALLPGTLHAQVLSGQAAFTDYAQQAPGLRHRITLADLPQPNPAEAVDNGPTIVPRPDGAWPLAPAGFKVTLYAGGDATPMQRSENQRALHAAVEGTFVMPRLMRTAPDGDVFLADSQAGIVFVMRGVAADGRAQQIEKFATGLDHPFGINFYPAHHPQWVYVGTATTIVRFAYKRGDLQASTAPQVIVPDIPGYAQLRGGGHWTRDVVFTADGRHMLVSVGSGSNADDADTHPREFHRADILEYTPDGHFERVYATGLRNCVGEAIQPGTGALWCSTNERDNLGNHLVPDFVTSVPQGSFFGWPWYYMGGHQDPRLPQPCAEGTGPNPQRATPLTEAEAKDCRRVDLSAKVRTPDVIVQPHMASLEMTFYPDRNTLENIARPADDPRYPPMKGGMSLPTSEFPASYVHGIFAAEHGSWNRAKRAGYEVIFIPLVNGKSSGEYDDFLTNFVTKDGQVWGRPVGVTVMNDGSLLVSDDGSRSVWRVSYAGR
jgi:glucose/arabinose dehydrogenase